MSVSDTPHKIIIAGLDSVGKTSIYKKVIEGAGNEEVENLAPTRGIERRSQIIMGHEIIFWDLGGQSQYRYEYFQSDRVFLNTSILIYVLDVQDGERFDQSLEYLLQILMVVKHLEDTPRIFILLHKFDPDSANLLKSNLHEALKVFDDIKRIPSLDVTKFPTSIYSDNLDFVFKKILQRIIPSYSNPLMDFDYQEDEQEPDDSAEVVAEVEFPLQNKEASSINDLRLELTKHFEVAMKKVDDKWRLNQENEE